MTKRWQLIEKILKLDGPGSGWWGPPKGTHAAQKRDHLTDTPYSSEHYRSRREPPYKLLNVDSQEFQGWHGDRRAIANMGLYNYNNGMDEVVVIKQFDYDKKAVGMGTLSVTRWTNPYPEMAGKYREIAYVATASKGWGRVTMDAVIKPARAEGEGVFLKAIPASVGFYEAIGMRRGSAERVFYWTPQDVQEMKSPYDN